MNSSVSAEIRKQVEQILRKHPVDGAPLTAKSIFELVDCADELADVSSALQALHSEGLATRAGAYGWRLASGKPTAAAKAPAAARTEPPVKDKKPPATPRNSPHVEFVRNQLREAFGKRVEPFCFKDVLKLFPNDPEGRLRWIVQDMKERGLIESAGLGVYRLAGQPSAPKAPDVTLEMEVPAFVERPSVEPEKIREIRTSAAGEQTMRTYLAPTESVDQAEVVSHQVKAPKGEPAPADEKLGPHVEMLKLDGGDWWLKARSVAGVDVELTGPADVAFAVAGLLLRRPV